MIKREKRVTALSLSVMLMLNMTATAVPVSAATGESKIYTHDGYTVEYTIKNEWTGNQNIEVTITNTGDDVLSGWAMGYNAFGEIGGLWNAKIYGHQGTEYILSSAGYNDELVPGQSTNFGYTLTGDKFKIPQNIVNCAERVDITEGYNVYYNITGDYGDTYQAEMVIENLSDTDINAWQLNFDGNASIDNLWNGKLLENNNGSFKVKNAENNSVIAAGGSASFNFSGRKLDEEAGSDVIETSAPATEPAAETTVVTDVLETDIAVGESETESISESEFVTEREAVTEPATVIEQESETKTEVVFGNFKLTGVIIPMEFDFEIDPEIDSDEDGLPDYLEKEIGTDRYNADTDGDGLPDGYEYFTLGTDPKKADSDDNGVSDADEDFDEDRLTNLEEYELGTDPFSKDTDYDGLSDYDEVKIHNTDPLKYDTDGDKVSDGDEIELGLDPNNPATNGYPDNEYTTKQTVGEDSSALNYINTIEDNPYTVSVEITAAGVAENNLSAGESGYSYSILQNDAVLGVVPELSYSDGLSVTDVVIKFKLDTNAAETSIDKLMVFKYFEDTNMLLPIETTYDASTNVISTHVDEVGTYCLINVEKWLGILEETPAGNYYEGGENEPANIVFCLDTRSVIDAESFNAVKNDIKTITENAFDRYSDIKVYVYYQQFGSNFKAANKLLTDSNGNNCFTGYEEAVAALDKLETYMIKNNYWAYDFVEATQFMIDNCDEKIIAMYHVTADDRVMGGINKAKKLTQTVRNSKYTTADGEKIQRIYVSTLCPNDTEPFDTSSYAYELAALSKGIAVTGYDANEDTEVMTAEIESVEVYASNTDETKTSSNVKKNLTDILGEGNNATYPVITSNGLVSVKLRKMLKRDSLTDTDEDGISDWNEVNVEIIEEIGYLNSNTETLRYDDLPTLGACLDRFSKYGYVYVEEGFNQLMSNESMHTVLNYPILPIYSDPTKADSDGDGFFDGITGKYQPTGYYKVADKWPLSSKPHPAFYQEDGEYYFNKFDFPKTYVGGRPGGYALHTLNLDKEEQKYIYTLCSIVNNDDNFSGEISPLLIMAICAHETGCQCIYNTGTTDVMGYMQTNYKYIDAYCKDGQYDDVWLENIRFEVSKWTNVNQNDFNILAEKTDKPCIDKLLKDNPFVNIMFGMAFLYQHCIDQTDMWSGLKHYCWIGDNYSPLEDTYYTEILVELIDEEMPYEKGEEYNENEEIPVYQVFINGVPVPLKLSK